MNGSTLGCVVIGDHRFPVDSVRLTEGAVRVTFTLHGPTAPFNGHITVIGDDGQGIMQGHEVKMSAVPDDATWECHEDMRFSVIESYHERVEY